MAEETVGQEFDACTVVVAVDGILGDAARTRVTRIVCDAAIVAIVVVAGQRRYRRTPDTSCGRRRRDVVSVS